ncbi:hypothetical protein AGMMS49521_3360 [Campylobacterota bacterium]|nr:hypothetical protein AGMMS49521_3360 [Campylobacterota bacterium]
MSKHDDGSRRMRYIGLFDNNKSMTAVTINRDGTLLWNVIPTSKSGANGARKGWLLYALGLVKSTE